MEERTAAVASPQSIAEKLAAAAVAAALAAGSAVAAEFQAAPHEVWSGTYQCDAIESDPARWPGYNATIRLVLDDGVARIVKESARIRETLSGKVGSSGALTLEGAGTWKDQSGTRWRYRFDGQFEGSRFEAQGVMLSAAIGTTLRTCSMTLTRVHASQTPQIAAHAAFAKATTAPRLKPSIARVQPPIAHAEEPVQVPVVTDTSAPAQSSAAAQGPSDEMPNSPEVGKTTNGPIIERAVTRPALERTAASDSGWSLKPGWLAVFLALAALAALMDRFFVR